MKNKTFWGIDSSDSPEKQLEEYRMIEDEFSRLKLTNINQLATIVCIALGKCSQCPVVIHNYDTRAQEDRANFVMCQEMLYKWIRDEILKQEKENKEDEYH